MSSSSNRGRGQQQSVAMEGTLVIAKPYIQSGDYSKAIALLQKARNMCECSTAFRKKHGAKEHSSAKACLRETLLSAAVTEDANDAVYRAALEPCSCGAPKLRCENAVHMDVLDKMAACSAAMGKNEAAVGFAAAAIHLDPKSPVGYCRLSKLIRTRTSDEAMLRSEVDNEIMASAIVRHGLYNVKTYGDVAHPLYKVLQVIWKNLYRKDPLRIFPPELKVMVLSHLDTLELVRCQRVSKRWLFAIRDDPNLWKKLLFIFNSEKSSGKPAKLAKGVLKLITRTKRASTLGMAPTSLDAGQYQLIFSQLKDLRHLHLESISPQPAFDQPCKEPPRRLTRISFFVPGCLDSLWLRSLVRASASTLEELQVHGQIEAVTCQPLPRLRILRVSVKPTASLPMLSASLNPLSIQAQNLEQLCLEGCINAYSGTDTFDDEDEDAEPVSYTWPRLKVLVIGSGVKTNIAPRHRLIPPGLQILDNLGLNFRYSLLSTFSTTPDLTSLRHVRFMDPVEPEDLARLLAPSIANGKLETLCLRWNLSDLHGLKIESQHVQALGLTLDDAPPAHKVAPAYLNWVEKFPNAHTFAIDAGPAQVSAALASLVLRPGTQRIFETAAVGVNRDRLLEEARARGVDFIRACDFPVIFPWGLEDCADEGGEGRRLERAGTDVVEQWEKGRGRITGGPLRVRNQPFFRE